CVLYAGYDPADEKEDLVYLAVNTYWEPVTLTLPPLPNGMSWKIAVNTGDPGQNYFSKGNMPDAGNHILMKERSVIVLEA
ncbi:MAG: glycogen debranching enzyme, partial [Schaedlerella arabinosiphila]|nr:glycogen debranching enzyme [Schaedlerella arabinosiphila]